ncbi:MAG TPA: sigma-70 family RNA polymerase sigma factor [Pyrinomonadaceae bacterium]|nr:sigma-70 family RNA polymerase sigma factor [Pyrinomonadaceae bacterium]
MLRAWSDGDRAAAEQFMPLIYNELRRQARRYMNRENPNHTLQTTALVHEAFIRLNEQHGIKWQNRAHFFALSAQMMRRILVNYAVAQKREKRGGVAAMVTLDDGLQVAAPSEDVDVLELDEALTRLAKMDPRQVQIVELRYFSGLSIEETGDVLGISPATVKREWNVARTWLRAELTRDSL